MKHPGSLRQEGWELKADHITNPRDPTEDSEPDLTPRGSSTLLRPRHLSLALCHQEVGRGQGHQL